MCSCTLDRHGDRIECEECYREREAEAHEDLTKQRSGEPLPAFETIEWSRDPAASGWRSRAWLDGSWGHDELIAYDDGAWEVRRSTSNGHTVAQGKKMNGERAKGAAYRTWLCYVESEQRESEPARESVESSDVKPNGGECYGATDGGEGRRQDESDPRGAARLRPDGPAREVPQVRTARSRGEEQPLPGVHGEAAEVAQRGSEPELRIGERSRWEAIETAAWAVVRQGAAGSLSVVVPLRNALNLPTSLLPVQRRQKPLSDHEAFREGVQIERATIYAWLRENAKKLSEGDVEDIAEAIRDGAHEQRCAEPLSTDASGTPEGEKTR